MNALRIIGIATFKEIPVINKNARRVLIRTAFLFGLVSCLHVGEVLAYGDASLGEQLVQQITMSDQLIQQMQQVQQQVTMVSQGAQNLQALGQQAWNSVAAPLQDMTSLVGQAQGLAYKAISTAGQVKSVFGDPTGSITNYQQKLQGWVGNNQQQMANVMQGYNKSAQAFQLTQSGLTMTQAASQSAAGHLQALQAGNQIAGMQVNELQNLHADIIAGNQVLMDKMAADQMKELNTVNVLNQIHAQPLVKGGF